MKYYRMTNKLTESWNGIEPPVIYKKSHKLTTLKTGHRLTDYGISDAGAPFTGPLICLLDDEEQSGILPSLFLSPALIGTRALYQDIINLGVDNIEMHEVVIKDIENGRDINDYVLMNVLGLIQCADMDASEVTYIGDDIPMINKLVIDKSKVAGLHFFLIAEDTDCIVISERIYLGLQEKGYQDIHFEEIA